MARRIIGLTLAAALVLLLTGCGGAKARPEETASDDSIISAPGNIVVGENSGETASKTNSSTIENLIDLAREIQTTGVRSMSFEAFDTKKLVEYAAQAKARWGATAAYREYEKRSGG